MIVQWILMTMFPPILDFTLDYYNGFRAIKGLDMSRAARSLHWAMFINVIVTPMLAALIIREATIDQKLNNYLGKILKVEQSQYIAIEKWLFVLSQKI